MRPERHTGRVAKVAWVAPPFRARPARPARGCRKVGGNARYWGKEAGSSHPSRRKGPRDRATGAGWCPRTRRISLIPNVACPESCVCLSLPACLPACARPRPPPALRPRPPFPLLQSDVERACDHRKSWPLRHPARYRARHRRALRPLRRPPREIADHLIISTIFSNSRAGYRPRRPLPRPNPINASRPRPPIVLRPRLAPPRPSRRQEMLGRAGRRPTPTPPNHPTSSARSRAPSRLRGRLAKGRWRSRVSSGLAWARYAGCRG